MIVINTWFCMEEIRGSRVTSSSVGTLAVLDDIAVLDDVATPELLFGGTLAVYNKEK